jgi:hypothetical protein
MELLEAPYKNPMPVPAEPDSRGTRERTP